MKKKFISLLTALSMSLALFVMPNNVAAADTTGGCDGTHSGMTEWTSTNSLPTDAGTYYLSDDVNVTAQTEITADITLCLNGHTVKYTGSSGTTARIFNIANGGSLTLCDCQGGGTLTGGKVSGSYQGGAINIDYNGKFTMYGGKISGNLASGGGGVYTKGTFIMENGEISNNTSRSHGGGVTVSSGTFTMNGGSILSNIVSINGNTGGGGVCVYGGTFTMNGGTISNNNVMDRNVNGGGILVNGGKFEINGNVTISGNTKQGSNNNNVYLDSRVNITIGENFSTDNPIGVNRYTSLNSCENSQEITDETSTDISGSFTSDSGYLIIYEDNKVKMIGSHTFETGWTSDGTNHWHAATCEHTEEKSGNAAHTWDEGVVTTEPTETAEGVKTYTCTACQTTKTESVPKTSAVTSVTTPAETETPDSGSSAPETTEPPVSDSESTAVTAPPTVTTPANPAVTTYIPPVVTLPAETAVTSAAETAAEEIIADEPYDEDVSAGAGVFEDGEKVDFGRNVSYIYFGIALIAVLCAVGVYFKKSRGK